MALPARKLTITENIGTNVLFSNGLTQRVTLCWKSFDRKSKPIEKEMLLIFFLTEMKSIVLLWNLPMPNGQAGVRQNHSAIGDDTLP